MSLVEPGLPWSWDACARGWEADPEAGGEHDYWFDEAWIEGTIPSSLRGTLLRNGPGGVQVQGHPLRHPIDGDGLVCKLVFPGDGRVHFRSRFVASRHRQAETEAGRLLYRGQMGTLPADFSRLRASLDTVRLLISGRRSATNRFRNPSNTNAVYWNGKLLTAYETQRPHALDPITLETLGLDDLGGALTPVRNLAAHFREDPRTGHLVTMSARPAMGSEPALVMFSEFDAEWQLVRQQVHHVDGLNYVHDFAMTPHYIIVQMTPFVSVTTSERIRILTGVSSPGESMFHYPASPCRLVVIPRATAPGVHVDDPELAPIHFDDTSAVHIFHFGTAFETSEGLELTAVCLPESFDMRWQHRVWLSNASEAP
ncbi:MAG: carotenoid oxygenase family protein, partial [Myxococcota bacterium]|nr:carotenoid oxygenase family protein [Myxococcota bacterium]